MGKKLTLEIIQKKAKRYGGVVLSTEYKSVRTKMRFKCKEGHVWRTFPYNINAGCWCPKCGNKKIGQAQRMSIMDMKSFAKENDGKCLSLAKDYENIFSKLKWQCSKGHKFRACYHNLRRRRHWCTKCA